MVMCSDHYIKSNITDFTYTNNKKNPKTNLDHAFFFFF